ADADLARLAPRDRAPGAEVIDVVAHDVAGSAFNQHLALLGCPVKTTPARRKVARALKTHPKTRDYWSG
ncbi:MAG TPA: hypothetical protein PLH23_01750, partial [Hyphomonadaceae bacterium]|nr:hypothetical protein [Hyphomonadaceae bacterium]